MDIKNKLVLIGITWAVSDNIECNIIGEFQTSNSNTPGYYAVQWKVNAYTLEEQYICHTFYPPVIIPEVGLVCPSNFMTPMRNIPIGITSHMEKSL